MANDTEFTDTILGMLNDHENPNNQTWVREHQTKVTAELDNIPQAVLEDSFPYLKHVAFHGVKSRLRKREQIFLEDNEKVAGGKAKIMKNNTEQFRSSDNLTKENKYSISKQRGAKRKTQWQFNTCPHQEGSSPKDCSPSRRARRRTGRAGPVIPSAAVGRIKW